jgi:hypothetical protein
MKPFGIEKQDDDLECMLCAIATAIENYQLLKDLTLKRSK